MPRPTEHPPTPTTPIPGKQLLDSQRGAVTLLRKVLRKIEGWQVNLKSGKLMVSLEDMGETGCEIDDFLNAGG